MAQTSELRDTIDRILADNAVHDGVPLSEELSSSLVSALESFPAYAAVRGKQLNTGAGSVGFSTDMLALAILRRAEKKGAAEALRELEEFVTRDERDGRFVMVISSVFVSTPITIGEGISLVPLDSLKSDTIQSYRRIAPIAGGHMLKVSAALVIRHRVRPAFKDASASYQHEEFSGALAQLQDARRCLCFFGPSTPVDIVYFWEAADDAFGLEGTSWTGPLVELIGHEHAHAMTGEELQAYCGLVKRFLALPEHHRRVLRVAIDRVNRSLRRHWSVDAAIELGVALEAFFLSDVEQSELTYRLQLRCAWWLGGTADERRGLMEWAAVTYKCRSVAVHTGHLAEKLQERWAKGFRGLDTRKFIHAGCARVLYAIRSAVERGMPDWPALVVGAGT